MRGSFCQALPIGCMRVRMTPSCSSAVTLESRCSGTLNSESSWRRTMSSSWLRVSTSSDTMVIRFSSVSTLTRIDLLATLASALSSSSCRPAGFSALGLCAARRWRGAATRRRPRRLAERALQLVERDLARPQRPLQRLRHAADVRLRGAARACSRHLLERTDQIGVGALRLALVLLELGENVLDAIDGEQDQRDRFAGHRHAVAEFAHQGFGGVRQRLEARQAEEAAGALDGVDEAEDVAENLGVVGLLLETHELDVDHVEALVGLDQEFPQQIVHCSSLRSGERGPPGRFRPRRPVCRGGV